MEWSPTWGTPLLVRGPGLNALGGVRGRGLPTGTPAAFDQQALALLGQVAAVYGMQDAAKEFAAQRTDADELGFHHVRLAQMHQGLRVVGGDLIVHFNANGEAYQINGQYVPGLALAIAARLDGEQAVKLAQQDLAGQSRPAGSPVGAAALVVLARGGVPRLAYELTLDLGRGKRGPERWRYWVDAQSGEMLERYNDIKKIAPPTSNGNQTAINGYILTGENGSLVTVSGWFENTGYYYLHSTNRHWQVYNVATNGWPDANTYAYRTTASWGTTDRAEMSLARNFELTQQFYTQVLGRNSFNNGGMLAVANAHEGVSYVNAYWDGAQFYFGDGDNSEATSLAVLDVAAHEYTHAVTDYTADLVYSYESGALNESFSDVMGACVEFYAEADGRGLYPSKSPGTADWLCGEDCWLSSVALRDLRNPRNTATVGAGNEQPSRYRGTYWYTGTGDNGGVHYNSGVQNFFFYLLCEGGSGNNDGIAYNLTGIGVTNAQRVAFRALTVYCTSSTDYNAVRSAWISAAMDLNAGWAPAVSAAWSAVGINALQIQPTTSLTFRGPEHGPFTPATQTWTLVNRSGSAMNWTLVSTQAWASVSPTSGTIAAGASAAVSVAITTNANALLAGIYTNRVAISNHVDMGWQVAEVRLLVGQPDYFTELYSDADNDTDFKSWTFTPDGSASFYSACLNVATNFPTDPTGGTTVTLSDDSYATVTLSGGSTVALYSRRTNVLYISSNGYLTFGTPDTSYSESISNHFRLPRIAVAFDDLDPSSGGTVSWKQTNDLVAVTFQNVREYGGATTVNFQIELFYSGVIRVTCLAMGITDGLIGLSAGAGVPSGFMESDMSAYPECPPPDGLLITPSASFVTSGYQGGPFSPTSTSYLLRNVGSNTFTWRAGTAAAWLTVAPATGSLAVGATTTVNVALSGAAVGLAPATYTARIGFTNVASGYEQRRDATLQVIPIPGEIAVLDSIVPTTDLLMPFGQVYSGASRTERITITNTDAAYGVLVSDVTFGSYVENFDDGLAQNWVPDVAANWQVVAGEYQASTAADDFMVSRYLGDSWGNVSIQAGFRRTGSADASAGLLIRGSDDFDDGVGSGYVFQIAVSGSYAIWKQVNGSWSWLQSWTTSSAILTGANVLAVEGRGANLAFYINGTLVWSGSDSSLVSGRIGLLGYSSPTAVATHYFDNVSVGDPGPSLTRVGSQQQYYNKHPLGGTDPRTTPGGPVVAPDMPGDSVRIASFVSGPWQLQGVPTLPFTVPPRSSVSFDVVYSPTTPASNYAKVQIVSNDADEPRVEVQVNGLAVPDPLTVSPATGLASMGHPGGPFSPATLSYVVSNNTALAMQWSATTTQAWVNVSPTSGTLAANQATTVTVGFSAAANALPVGSYTGQVVFSNRTTTVTTRRPVALTVFTSPSIAVSPASFSVTNGLGGVTDRTLVVSNRATADGNLTFSVNAVETGRTNFFLPWPSDKNGMAPRTFTAADLSKEHTANRLLVRFAKGVDTAARTQLLATLGGAQIAQEYRLVPGLCVVDLPAGQSVAQALTAYNAAPGVLYAEPDYRVHVNDVVPNDPRFGELWGMRNTGQTGGTPGADIHAPAAWALQTGSRQVLVAVIDTGVDYTHPDLMNNAWTNPGEIPGNGIDDDGNGYVDDVHGYDFINRDGDPMDDNGHGTHCSGTIGAEGNNSLGVAGVCWQVRIMGVKFLDSLGSGSTADAISCVQYATLMHARVLNNSWGGGSFSQALKDAIDAAGAAGIVFVAAAGNNGTDNDTTPQYPASYTSSNILAVINTDANDLRASSSCYGLTSVDLGAPGTSILSCAPGGGYQLMSGTSMATPHVTGACALLLAANPLLTVAGIREALLTTVDPTLPGLCVSGGRLNLVRALASAGAAWITVAPTGGTNLVPGASANINVRFSAGTLEPGLYSGQVQVTCNDVITPNVAVPASMTIRPDTLGITPREVFASTGTRGGPFTPSQVVYALTNLGAVALPWQVTHTQTWFSVSSSGGTLPAGGFTTVTGTVNAVANALTDGLYVDTLVFSNATTTAKQGRDLSLTVQPPEPLVIHNFPLDTDPGWAREGQWAFGVPTGGGSGNGDPTTGHTGANVLGYNLAGDYANSMPNYYLTTPALDCSGYQQVRLRFWRWLGVESSTFDHANVQVSTNGTTWTTVWDHTSSSFSDSSWQLMNLDISAVADRQSALYVRWGMGPTDGSVTYPGWNLDDIAITGFPVDALVITPSDGLSSAGIPGGPFSPVSRSYTLLNQGADPMPWSAGANQPWLTMSARGGVLAAGVSTNVTVSINSAANSLPVGSYSAITWFTNVTSGANQSRLAQLTVAPPTPPVITNQPLSQTVEPGTTVTFTVGASGTPPLRYQWRKNGVNLTDGGRVSGAQTNRLVLSNVVTNDSADYSVVVSNAFLPAALSANATLVVRASPGVVTNLPYYLYDGENYIWDVSYDGSITDGSNDAFDGGLVLSGFPMLSSAILAGGRELWLGPTNVSGLQITRRIYVPANQGYARFLEVIRNAGGAAVTTTVRLDSNLGSDSSTVIVGTSSGDTTFTVADDWIVTDDTDGSGDPTVTHVIANSSAVARPSAVSYSTGMLGYQYSVTVPPGETRIVMHFAAQSANRAAALAKATDLAALSRNALAGLTSDEIARIVNFGAPAPRVALAGATLVAEGCQAPNGAVDPTETVTINVSLANLGGVTATNVVATLQASGGVIPLSGSQSYGTLPSNSTQARPFRLTTVGSCGGTATATLQVTVNGQSQSPVTLPITLGAQSVAFAENFDSVSAPALPSGWTASLSGAGSAWATSTANRDTLPNSVFAGDPSSTSDNLLTSPAFVATAGALLSFRHAYSTESCCDGGSLQISINGGAFTDFVTAGGTFLTNGYSTPYGWYGTSVGFPAFITTVATMPPSAAGQSVRLRWEFVADYSVSATGWYVDSIVVSGGYACCVGCPDMLPPVVSGSQMTLSFPTVTGHNYVILQSPTLTNPTWQTVQTVPGNGGVVSVNLPVAGTGHRYYRLAIQ